jgi:hypothetical protein
VRFRAPLQLDEVTPVFFIREQIKTGAEIGHSTIKLVQTYWNGEVLDLPKFWHLDDISKKWWVAKPQLLAMVVATAFEAA